MKERTIHQPFNDLEKECALYYIKIVCQYTMKSIRHSFDVNEDINDVLNIEDTLQRISYVYNDHYRIRKEALDRIEKEFKHELKELSDKYLQYIRGEYRPLVLLGVMPKGVMLGNIITAPYHLSLFKRIAIAGSIGGVIGGIASEGILKLVTIPGKKRFITEGEKYLIQNLQTSTKSSELDSIPEIFKQSMPKNTTIEKPRYLDSHIQLDILANLCEEIVPRQMLKKIIREDKKELDNAECKCSITHSKFSNPIIISNGRIYEAADIRAHYNASIKSGRQCFDPNTREEILLDPNIVYQENIFMKLYCRYKREQKSTPSWADFYLDQRIKETPYFDFKEEYKSQENVHGFKKFLEAQRNELDTYDIPPTFEDKFQEKLEPIFEKIGNVKTTIIQHVVDLTRDKETERMLELEKTSLDEKPESEDIQFRYLIEQKLNMTFSRNSFRDSRDSFDEDFLSSSRDYESSHRGTIFDEIEEKINGIKNIFRNIFS